MEDKIRIDAHYTRSINLERDATSTEVLQSYIPTSRALQTLDKIAATFSACNMPRAWSLIGPYGSGKSSFAAFLAHLLENQELKNNALAESILQNSNTVIAKKYVEHTTNTNAYCIVLLTGSPESLSTRLCEALYQGALNYDWHNKKLPPIVQQLLTATKQLPSLSSIIDLIDKLQQAVLKVSGKGILIIIDELGKFLEYEARHQQSDDMFLLQAIAEYAYTGRDANVMLLVLMHQAFEQYAKGLSENLRNEWVKVQGRFESIPFLESSEQTLRVIASAFKQQLSQDEWHKIAGSTTAMLEIIDKQNALPPGLSQEAAQQVFVKCYPLHPIAAIILPVLCQKVAQNERTLFSYLSSQEHYGFKDGLKRLDSIGQWVLPWEIFEYFIANQPAATFDHGTHRRWAEVISALERLGDSEAIEQQVLKTIGLFNIIGNQNGLKASEELLAICFQENANISRTLEQLQRKSLINYRKFSSEYRIWEGSDFDLESSVQAAIEGLGRFNLAELLNRRKPMQPQVARRYSIKMGVIRYFQFSFADSATPKQFFERSEQPRIICYLAETQDDTNKFTQRIEEYAFALNLYVLNEQAEAIRQVVSEVIALERIQTQSPEIKSDPVAQRELKDRLSVARRLEDSLLNQLIEQPHENQWVWKNEYLPKIVNGRALQQQLSDLLEQVYHKSPLIKNELVNRQKSSGQANAAKNKLIAALLSQSHINDLGFDSSKYPAEKSIYRAVFKETSVHREHNGVWQILEPIAENEYGLHHIWQGIDSYLQSNSAPTLLPELYAYLELPPYGIQKGVLPLLFIGYYLSKQRALALYESGVFCPQVSQETFEILLKRPELFAIEKFDISGIRAELFNTYLEKLVGKVPEESTLLDIVKPLAKFIAKLPEYTKATRELDAQTIAVRDAFQNTQSPVKLLFDVLPKACGFPSYIASDFEDSNPNEFLNVLVQHLNSLNQAYVKMLLRFQQQLSNAFKESDTQELHQLRVKLTQRYKGLEKYTTDGIGLKAFILRLCNDNESDQAWLESIAAFLGKAPPAKWQLSNQSNAEFKLMELSERLQQLTELHRHRLDNPHAEVAVIRLMAENVEVTKPVFLDAALKNQAREMITKLNASSKFDEKAKLALMAELMRELQNSSQIH